ncbi:MAG: mitochondria protoheme IX farnesyltransferase [Lasallia pustulata]|uniref:Protoheme IX farnesyltransferase, mitochondrial n=1 Tax=Lasallia pustulata TaxID=136370 RepID=A0A5M8PLL6_9LECA|nr:MAG: mitochondria protoheme IX farnesyltransferase [Lasallia pustulata]
MILRPMPLKMRLLGPESVCLSCLLRYSTRSSRTIKRAISSTAPSVDATLIRLPRRGPFRRDYFSANAFISGTGRRSPKTAMIWGTKNRNIEQAQKAVIAEGSTHHVSSTPLQVSGESRDSLSSPELPHRRRKRLKEEASNPIDPEPSIPLDASSRLSTLSSTLPPSSLRRLLTTCLSLSKPRLSFLIVLTTATAYSLYPVPAVLLPSTTISPSLSTLTLAYLTTGTALCCASANALNMLLEPQHDAKMSRTRNRPLVRGLIGKRGALIFAVVAGVAGIGGLWFGVNPTVAFLGALNIVLYAGVYTPMKRISVINTWVGAIVGGIPPLMGWAAGAGQSATGSGDWKELLLGEENLGGWLLAGLLFAWQFPHFNALSWPIREEYKNAGYRMLVWVNPRMNGRVALRYSLLLFPICIGMWWVGVTDQGFLVTSSVVNAWVVREAWKFWRREGNKGSARGLFWASVWHLPVVMVLAMGHKKGLWEGIWKRVVGEEQGEETWLEEEDELINETPQGPLVRPATASRASLT